MCVDTGNRQRAFIDPPQRHTMLPSALRVGRELFFCIVSSWHSVEAMLQTAAARCASRLR